MQEVCSCWICVGGCGSGAGPDGFIPTPPCIPCCLQQLPGGCDDAGR